MFEGLKFWKKHNVWPGYSEATKDRPVHALTIDAMRYIGEKGRALDLGPGAMNESRFLLEQGFKSVTAVNMDPLESDPVASERVAQFPNDRFEYVASAFDKFDFEPDTYDFINAQRSLPFNPPETFDRTFASLLASLKSGGILAGNFFGTEDEWKKNRSMTFVTREKAEELLKDCEIIVFKENKGQGTVAGGGDKYWHTFDFIVRKK